MPNTNATEPSKYEFAAFVRELGQISAKLTQHDEKVQELKELVKDVPVIKKQLEMILGNHQKGMLKELRDDLDSHAANCPRIADIGEVEKSVKELSETVNNLAGAEKVQAGKYSGVWLVFITVVALADLAGNVYVIFKH